MTCGLAPVDAPRIRLLLVASGEPGLRLERRLQCAATGLGLELDLQIRNAPDAVGLRFEDTPAVLQDGRVLFTGLLRTEEIEARLRAGFAKLTGGSDAHAS